MCVWNTFNVDKTPKQVYEGRDIWHARRLHHLSNLKYHAPNLNPSFLFNSDVSLIKGFYKSDIAVEYEARFFLLIFFWITFEFPKCLANFLSNKIIIFVYEAW